MNDQQASDRAPLSQLAHSYAVGDDAVGDAICSRLAPRLHRAVARFMADPNDRSDLVQETLVAALQFLRRMGRFEGDFAKFAVTVACNRCRDLLHFRQRRPELREDTFSAWIADPARSPLDVLVDSEVVDLLHEGLAGLDIDCRELLSGLYLGAGTVEEFRRRAGLGSVQAVYYRRMICLRKLADFFQNRLQIRFPSSGGRRDDGSRS